MNSENTQMVKTLKNVIADLHLQIELLQEEKEYLINKCRNCDSCPQRQDCIYCKEPVQECRLIPLHPRQ